MTIAISIGVAMFRSGFQEATLFGIKKLLIMIKIFLRP